MADFDEFSNQLLEESKKFLEKAVDANDQAAKDAYLHASLMLSCSALEARINSIAADAAEHRSDLALHEKALLLEREVRLEHGSFKISTTLKMTRLDERVEFIFVRLSGKPLDRSQSWWKQLMEAIRLRNELTHPKMIPAVNEKSVSAAVKSVVDTFNALSLAIYGKKYPAANRGLTSKMQF